MNINFGFLVVLGLLNVIGASADETSNQAPLNLTTIETNITVTGASTNTTSSQAPSNATHSPVVIAKSAENEVHPATTATATTVPSSTSTSTVKTADATDAAATSPASTTPASTTPAAATPVTTTTLIVTEAAAASLNKGTGKTEETNSSTTAVNNTVILKNVTTASYRNVTGKTEEGSVSTTLRTPTTDLKNVTTTSYKNLTAGKTEKGIVSTTLMTPTTTPTTDLKNVTTTTASYKRLTVTSIKQVTTGENTTEVVKSEKVPAGDGESGGVTTTKSTVGKTGITEEIKPDLTTSMVVDTGISVAPPTTAGTEEQSSVDGLQQEPYLNLKKPIPQEESSSNFPVLFMISILAIVGGYFLYHNKSKIMGLIVEGRGPGSRRPRYNRLKNVEEAMPGMRNKIAA